MIKSKAKTLRRITEIAISEDDSDAAIQLILRLLQGAGYVRTEADDNKNAFFVPTKKAKFDKERKRR